MSTCNPFRAVSTCAWILLCAAYAAAASNAGRMATLPVASRLHVIVLHTNDIHGQVLPRAATWIEGENPPLAGGIPRIAAYVNRVRAEARESHAELIVVDAGDWYQGTPEGSLDDGLGIVKALAQVGYDALCIGNHELDKGLPNLKRLLRDTAIPAVCGNLFDRSTHARVAWVEPYRVVERDGLRIAIVGLLTPATPEITHRDARELEFVEPARALTRVRAQLAGRVDWILPITHLGVDDDRKLARAHPDLPLIVGGHSHTYLKHGVREGDTRIVQTGSKASGVGRVDLWFERATWKVVESRARVVDLVDEPAVSDRNAAVDAICRELESRSEAEMKVVVGEFTGPLTRSKNPLESSPAGNWIADALRAHTRADVGLMNRGGIRCDLAAGPITRRHLFEISPFDNVVSVLTLTGAELFDVMRRSVEGEAHSGLEVSGLELEVEMGRSKQRRLAAIHVGEKPLDRAATYRVVMNSFMADGGDAYLEKREGAGRVDEPVLIREMLELALRAQPRVQPDASNRYRVRGR